MTISEAEIRERVHTILAEQAMIDPSDVDDTHSLESLGVDSMGLVEAIFAIEESFDIQVPFNANAPGASEFDISSVGSIVAAVRRLIAAQRG
ncbi:MAG: acyl carrier protein [Pseudomonadota bacterium]